MYPEIILTDTPLYALKAFDLGHPNTIGIRGTEQLKILLPLLAKHDTGRVYVLSRKRAKVLVKELSKGDVDIVVLKAPAHGLTADNLLEVGKTPLPTATTDLQLTDKTEQHLTFTTGQTTYRIESTSLSGLGMRVVVRAAHNGVTHLDKADLAAAQSRRKYARGAAIRLGLAAREIENALSGIADLIDEMQLKAVETKSRRPRRINQAEEKEALDLLRREDLLDAQAAALGSCGVVGEEENRRLAILIAASRLLPKPLGCIIRGAPSSGKSSLIMAVTRLLPASQVLFFSRLTQQALFFMPKEHLTNAVMVIDEYEGVSDSEYSLRTMMSSQVLSLAITVREGGRMPVTRTVEIPTRLAVFVSATHPINMENLSRFIELKMDTSTEQTRRVMLGMVGGAAKSDIDLQTIQNANQMLKPCTVEIPFGNELVFDAESVLARRRFAQVIGLVAAHAALYQMQRPSSDGVITATRADYAAVHPLLMHIADSPEETLSPAGTELLAALQQKQAVTIKEAMAEMRWSYSKTYRTLKELQQLRLVVPDRDTVGVERIYEVAPYASLDKGLAELPAPL